MFGCPWKNRNKWFPDNQDEKNPKPKKDITNYFSPKDKTITNEKEKDTKKEKQISAMAIDDEVSKGKEDKDATPLKEPKESKEKTINKIRNQTIRLPKVKSGAPNEQESEVTDRKSVV